MTAKSQRPQRSLFKRVFYPPSTAGAYAVFMEYFRVLAGALVLALAFRTFVASPYKIPSSSMVPTLLVGDYLFVSKYPYGFHIPLTNITLGGHAPKRGDIIVFDADVEGMGMTTFIKRIVATPGDTVAYRNKVLYINGKPVTEKYDGHYHGGIDGRDVIADLYTENLDGLRHHVLQFPIPAHDLAEVTVPEGKYVVLGDNRDNSLDSRAWQYPQWGFITRREIVGRAEFLFWSWDHHLVPRFNRMFTSLRHIEPVPVMGDK